MGALISKLKKTGGGVEPKRILMMGLDNAGKTTILYTLSLGETVTKTVPTIGFNVQTVTHKDISMSVWDVGGQAKIRGLWHHYLKGTHAVIYVVDSADAERLKESSEEFHNLLKEPEVSRAAVLVMANKRDIAGCLSLQEIQDGLKWDSITQTCELVETIATRNEGLSDALDFVTNQLKSDNFSQSRKLSTKELKPLNTNAADRLPVLTQKESDRAQEFKAAPLVTPHRKNSQNGLTAFVSCNTRHNLPEMSTSSNPANMTLVLTLSEAADMLKATQDEVVRLLQAGSIKGKRIAGEYRISTRTVVDYMERLY